MSFLCDGNNFILPFYELSHFALTRDTDVQQEAITVSIFGSQVFFDEVQVLLAFEITWMVGFVWCFFLQVSE